MLPEFGNVVQRVGSILAVEVGRSAVQVFEALSGEMIRNAVNVPSVDGKAYQQLRPVLDLAEKLGRFLSQFAKPTVKALEISYSGTAAEYPMQPLTTAVVKGFMEFHTTDTVNHVNAMYLAKGLGISVRDFFPAGRAKRRRGSRG